MAQGDAQAAIDRLNGVPLESFVAERKRLAGELRAAGDRAAAAEVAKLPKPTAAAWALNHVALEQPGTVQEWLQAAAALRDASTHVEETGGDALRAAITAHRAATAQVIDAVGARARPGGRPLSDAMLDRVRALLASATADAELAERLRAGRTSEEQAPVHPIPEREPRPERTATNPAPQPRAPKQDAGGGRAKRRAQLERRVGTISEKVDRLREEAARCAAAAQSAEERLEQARRTLSRSQSEAAAARGAATDAEAAAGVAERELRKLGARLRDAGG